MSDEQRFHFGEEVVSINSKHKLTVETLKDEDKIKTYLIQSDVDDAVALVQCTVKYIIVLYFGQESGYIKYKDTGARDTFKFKCPNGLESFVLVSFTHCKEDTIDTSVFSGVNYPGATDGPIQYRDGIFYFKRGYYR